MSMGKSLSPFSNESFSSMVKEVALKAIAFFWSLLFFSRLHHHLMCLEIFDESREVHFFPIIELLQCCGLHFSNFGEKSNDLPYLLVIINGVT